METEKLAADYDELEADINDVECALANLERQPNRNAVWMRVGYTQHNCIGRVQAHMLRNALTVQKLALQQALDALGNRLGKRPPLG